MKLLTAKEVQQLSSCLLPEQKAFLHTFLKQKRKSKWLEILSLKKGHMHQSHQEDVLSHEWELEDVLEAPEGTRPYKCECGTRLRYQYIVYHEGKKERYRLGKHCLENYTGIPHNIVNDIVKGVHTIHLERDELLIKVSENDFFDIAPYRHLSNEESLRAIFAQAAIGLPLLNTQIKQLQKQDARYRYETKRRHVCDTLTDTQKELLKTITKEEQETVIRQLMEEYHPFVAIPKDFEDHQVALWLEQKLPLPDRFLRRIKQHQEQRRLEEQKPLILPVSAVKNPTEEETLTYEILMERHLNTLKKVRQNEDRIARGLKTDWEMIQERIRHFKKGGTFDYDSFKLNLNNLLNQLRIEKDGYL